MSDKKTVVFVPAKTSAEMIVGEDEYTIYLPLATVNSYGIVKPNDKYFTFDETGKLIIRNDFLNNDFIHTGYFVLDNDNKLTFSDAFKTRLITIEGDISDLEDNKLDKDFSGLEDFGTTEPTDDDIIAINVGSDVKRMKVGLIKNKVESVNGINPTAGTKNVKITGSNINRRNETDSDTIDEDLTAVELELNTIKNTATFFNLFSDEDDPLDDGFTRNVMERIILLENITNSSTDSFNYYDLSGTTIEDGDILEFVIDDSEVAGSDKKSLFISISTDKSNRAYLPTNTNYSTISVGGETIGYQSISFRYIEIDIPSTEPLDRLGIKAGRSYDVGKLVKTPSGESDFYTDSSLTIEKIYVWKNTTLDEIGGTGGNIDDPKIL